MAWPKGKKRPYRKREPFTDEHRANQSKAQKERRAREKAEREKKKP